MDGIEKEIDPLGRVVIPARFRKKLGLESGAKVLILIDGDTICISAQSRICALCGSAVDKTQRIRLCAKCILKIKSE